MKGRHGFLGSYCSVTPTNRQKISPIQPTLSSESRGGSQEISYKKPSPLIFTSAIMTMQPRSTAYIADSARANNKRKMQQAPAKYSDCACSGCKNCPKFYADSRRCLYATCQSRLCQSWSDVNNLAKSLTVRKWTRSRKLN